MGPEDGKGERRDHGEGGRTGKWTAAFHCGGRRSIMEFNSNKAMAGRWWRSIKARRTSCNRSQDWASGESRVAGEMEGKDEEGELEKVGSNRMERGH
jgi:hypothetical protein